MLHGDRLNWSQSDDHLSPVLQLDHDDTGLNDHHIFMTSLFLILILLPGGIGTGTRIYRCFHVPETYEYRLTCTRILSLEKGREREVIWKFARWMGIFQTKVLEAARVCSYKINCSTVFHAPIYPHLVPFAPPDTTATAGALKHLLGVSMRIVLISLVI